MYSCNYTISHMELDKLIADSEICYSFVTDIERLFWDIIEMRKEQLTSTEQRYRDIDACIDFLGLEHRNIDMAAEWYGDDNLLRILRDIELEHMNKLRRTLWISWYN